MEDRAKFYRGMKSSAFFRMYLKDRLVMEILENLSEMDTESVDEVAECILAESSDSFLLNFEVKLEGMAAGGCIDKAATARLIQNYHSQFLRFIKSLQNANMAELEALKTEAEMGAKVAAAESLIRNDSVAFGPRKSMALMFLLKHGVEEYFKMVKEVMFDDMAFKVTCRFEDLKFSVMEKENLTAIEDGVPTVGSAAFSLFCGWIVWAWRQSGKVKRASSDTFKEKKILDGVSGVFRPGEATLVMGPPGSAGKSTLFHALTGKLKEQADGQTKKLSGSIKYNEMNLEDIIAPNYATMVEQIDTHLAMMSTRETIQFAGDCRGLSLEEYKRIVKDSNRATDLLGARVDLIMAILGLTRAADTVVGNDSVKGISGGEKRRLTFAEMLAGASKVIFCDEISTGLDSAATFDICRSLRIACRTLHITPVVSLLQPAPDVIALFDEVLLLNAGQIMYHGPTSDIETYFTSLGFTRPEYLDLGDYLQEVTSFPEKFLRPGVQEEGLGNVPQNPGAFAAAWKASDHFQNVILPELRQVNDLQKNSLAELYVTEAEKPFAHSSWYLTKIILKRNWRLFIKDKGFILAITLQSTIISLFIGLLMLQLDFDKWYLIAMAYYTMATTIGLPSISLLNGIIERRPVFYKQNGENFYPAISNVLAEMLTFAPLAIYEVFLVGNIIYFMCGLTLSNYGSRYFIFLAICICWGLYMQSLVRFFAYVCPSRDMAFAMTILVIFFMMVFSGGVATPDVIPVWWKWLFWINPLAWAYRSMLQSEFLSDEYTGGEHNNKEGECVDYCGVETDCPLPYPKENCGQYFLIARQQEVNPDFLWGGILYLIVLIFILNLGSAVALNRLRYDALNMKGGGKNTVPQAKAQAPEAQPLKKESEKDSPADVFRNKVSLTKEEALQKSQQQISSFKPVHLVWHELMYSVDIPDAESGNQKIDLLKNISGQALPYRLCCLMGSSGAGKTTLLDVLAGRKTTGEINGDILVNGFPKNDRVFRRICGYVEQFGVHHEKSTVREVLQFSARLRLNPKEYKAFGQSLIDETCELLELAPIMDTLIGNFEMGGLSFEQNKRVTIALELVANPSVLFLDEPTSGLDANAANTVMRGLTNISNTGRTVICTIHQPSVAIFEMFDDLLLLQTGGSVVYAGELGQDCAKLKAYFEAFPSVAKCGLGANPATWMLEVIGAGTTNSNSMHFDELYLETALFQNNMKEIDKVLIEPPIEANNITFEHDYAQTWYRQMELLVKRGLTEYWRTPSFGFARCALISFFCLVIGSVFWQQETDNAADIQSRVGAINLLMILGGNYNINTVIPFFFDHKPLLYRERASFMYSAWVYSIAETIVEFPYIVVEVALLVNISYWMIGLQPDTGTFFYFWLVTGLFITLMSWTGQLCSNVFPNSSVALLAAMLLTQLTSLTAGIYVPGNSFPQWMLFFFYSFPLRWTLEGLITTQFQDDFSVICYPNGNPTPALDNSPWCPINESPFSVWTGEAYEKFCCPVGNLAMSAKDYVLNGSNSFLGGMPGYQYEWRWWDVLYLVGILFIIRVLSTIAAATLSFQKR